MAGGRTRSGNKIAASAHGMGSGGLAVDAMAIGCLGVDRRVERFFSYLAIFVFFRSVSSTGAENQFQVDDNGHVGRPCEVSLAQYSVMLRLGLRT